MLPPGQAIGFDHSPPDGTYGFRILVKAGKMFAHKAIIEKGKMFSRAKLLILAPTVGSQGQCLGKGPGASPGANALQRRRNERRTFHCQLLSFAALVARLKLSMEKGHVIESLMCMRQETRQEWLPCKTPALLIKTW